ncbi:hypothetical protein O181_023871 [Austropuccinia psidii MF-1]|uniref:Uncharacterized protein n=1 Tax=Austropuccinia psidii MF-1 TaxID=1389203 RepID=A0A9Q3CFK0_9BASI|nr:hypothetical protein [Austropuccinia psidii MF-1]
MHLHHPPDETPALPPISTLTTPYASKPPPHLLFGLQSLRSCRALKLCLRRCPHPTLRLILCATYHPYACGVPSQHASNAAYHPYTCLIPQDETMMPSPISSLTPAIYHPYAPAAPSRYASDATLNPPYA